MGGVDEPGALLPSDAAVFFSRSRSLFAVVAHDGTMLRMSRSWEALLQRPLADLVGRSFTELAHPDDVARTLARVAEVAEGGTDWPPIENRYLKADGTSVWLRWDTNPYRDEHAAWCIARDITTSHLRGVQQEVAADLGRQALEGARLEVLFGSAAQGVVRGLDLAFGAVMQGVPGSEDIVLRASVGLQRADGTLLEVPVTGSVSGRAMATGEPQSLVDTAVEADTYPERVRDYGVRSVLSVPIGPRGAVWGALSAGHRSPRAFDEGEVRFLQQVAHVLASAIERREAEDRMQHEATHDSLTGLPNRQLLRERMNTALRDARRSGTAVGLLLCDLDGFKDVNDSLGHAAGDAVLQELAQRLTTTVGPGCTVARLGGDEFALCVVGPQTELEVLGIADRVISAMRAPFALPGLEVPLSTSIGVAISPTHGRDAATLLRHADMAMYRAKSRRLGWALYDAGLDAARAERLSLTTDLRSAVAAEGLALHYQPVVDLATGELRGVEALCRWLHPTRGAVPPTEFVALAEQTGLVVPLTAWVVERAARDARAWHDAGHEVRCAVNLSMAAVLDPRSTSRLLAALLAASDVLTVEITESWLTDARGQEVLRALA
ncbi:MAG: putative bifunctional diguanylate cyclase/phosphodiesterase, partial [Mycobacteriales bacterium]